MAKHALVIRTSDDVLLEAEMEVPADHWAAVVLAHPHPQYGGDMHAYVTDALFRALPEEAVAVLRFNFRGVGGSRGAHDNGVGERLDVAAAVKELAPLGARVPFVLSGYSFGADVSLNVVDERRVSPGSFVNRVGPEKLRVFYIQLLKDRKVDTKRAPD